MDDPARSSQSVKRLCDTRHVPMLDQVASEPPEEDQVNRSITQHLVAQVGVAIRNEVNFRNIDPCSVAQPLQDRINLLPPVTWIDAELVRRPGIAPECRYRAGQQCGPASTSGTLREFVNEASRLAVDSVGQSGHGITLRRVRLSCGCWAGCRTLRAAQVLMSGPSRQTVRSAR